MAGIGPPPKRDAERVRRNKPEYETDTVVALGNVEVPPLNLRKPKALVVDLYESHKASAQARYYEPSDWQVLRLNLQLLDMELKKPAVNGQVISTIMSTFGNLMSTEGERRRLRMEIERGGDQEDNVTDIASLLAERARQG